jgi:NAD(P)-dependent dehydrogenase (short-subunit alcohol dehydrogenase family)
MLESAPHQLSGPAGQVAFVTGATRGLGRVLAVALARAGMDIALVGRGSGSEAAAKIEALGRQALSIAADVSDGDSMDRAVQEAIARFGRIDHLICVAGVGSPGRPIWETNATDFRACFDVNVLGVMQAMRAVLPTMIAASSGRVVVIGGTFGHKGVANAAIYSASKWAVRGLVKSAALEVGSHGITVNLVSPGGVEGERLRRTFDEIGTRRGVTGEEVLDEFLAGTAMGRLIEPEEIAETLLHLLGPGGRMITGQDIVIDAGTIL